MFLRVDIIISQINPPAALTCVLDEIHFEWFKDTVRVLKFRPKSVLFLKWPENRTDTFGVVSLIVNIKY